MSEAEQRLQELPEEKRRFRILGTYTNTWEHTNDMSILTSFLCALIPAGAFLGTVGGVAALFGFSRTLMASKNEEQKLLEKGLIEGTHLLDAGSSLARRALGYGTLFALLGTGTLFFGVWSMSGASNVSWHISGGKLVVISIVLTLCR